MIRIYVNNGLVVIGKIKELKEELARLPQHQKLGDFCRLNLH